MNGDCSQHLTEAERDKNTLRSMLGTQLRVVLSDGRAVVGQFKCMDKQNNFILSNALETREETVEVDEHKNSTSTPGTSSRRQRERHLGLVMIPGIHLVSVKAEKTELHMNSLPRPPPSGVLGGFSVLMAAANARAAAEEAMNGDVL